MDVTPGAFTSAAERPDGNHHDGRSTLAFGPIRGTQWAVLGCDAGILACAPYRRTGSTLDETDVQFDTAWLRAA